MRSGVSTRANLSAAAMPKFPASQWTEHLVILFIPLFFVKTGLISKINPLDLFRNVLLLKSQPALEIGHLPSLARLICTHLRQGKFTCLFSPAPLVLANSLIILNYLELTVSSLVTYRFPHFITPWPNCLWRAPVTDLYSEQ